MNDFFSRMQRIADGRAITTWANSLGWNNATMGRVKKGHIPGPDLLTPLCRIENVSLNWLLEGRGTPYLVYPCADDDDAAQYLDTLLIDEPSWALYWLSDGLRHAVVLTQPAGLGEGDKRINYTAVEIVVGPLGAQTRQRAAQHDPQWIQLPPARLYQLETGQIGSHALLKADGGLLLNEKNNNKTFEAAVAEQPASYNVRERTLIERWRQLGPEDQDRLESITHALEQPLKRGDHG